MGGNELDEGIVATEESLYRSVVSHGPFSEQTRGVAADLVLTYNHLAMKKLSENNIKGAARLLQKAKLLTSSEQPFLGEARLQARALTLNNLGCLMKKWGKPHESVKFLTRALRIEAEAPGNADNPAGTHVNMSAALSTLGLHDAAAAHAGHAIDLAFQAMMEQETGSYFVGTEKGSTTVEGGFVGVDAGGVKGDGAVLGELAAANDGEWSVEGSTDNGDFPTVGFGKSSEGGSDARPVAAGTDGETVNSAVADDGHSTETLRSPLPVEDAGHDVPDKAREGVDVEPSASSTEATGGNENVQENTSLVERQNATSSAAGGLLAIAYFNLGVEREHLGQLGAAISSYEDACLAAKQYLGSENPVAKGFDIALENATAAAARAASYSRQREASRARMTVSSFPCIGKLQFSKKKTDRVSSFGGAGLSPRRQPQRWQRLSAKTACEATAWDLLERAYTSPRPCPTPPRIDPSPRSPAVAPSLASRSGSVGPQRTGRWTNTDTHVAQPVSVRRSQRFLGSRASRQCVVDEDLWWRALVCAEWQWSPREALRAQQQLAERYVEVEAAASGGDATQGMSLAPP